MATPAKITRKRKSIPASETKRRRAARSKLRRLKEIFIGDEINRWNELKEDRNLSTDVDVARLLLDFLHKHVPVEKEITSTPFKDTFSDISEVGKSSDSGRDEPMMSGVEELYTEPEPLQAQRSPICQTEDIDHLQILVDMPEELDDSGGSDSDDPTYSPSYCDVSLYDCSLDNLSSIDMEDVIFPIQDNDDYTETAGQTQEGKEKTDTGGKGRDFIRRIDNLTADVLEAGYLVFVSCLKDLANLSVPTKCVVKGCREAVLLHSRNVGTGVHLTWICIGGHNNLKWSSQPILHQGILLGDFLFSSAVMMSGNNFAKIALLFKFVNIGFVSKSTFARMQAHYVTPGIHNYRNEMRANQLLELSGKDIIHAGDGRMDSPGFCAEYCTYTAVDAETMKIVDLVIVDKREIALKSTAMESKAFVNVLENLKNAGVNVTEAVTDAHPQISSIMKKQYPTIKHSYDVWHGAKNLGKKLAKISLNKGCKDLKPWIGHITNHYWFCSRECETNPDTFLTKWQGVLPHVVNEHSWALGECEHEPVTDHVTEWIEANSASHAALRKEVLNTRFLHNIPYYVTFRSTSGLENFQNHKLMYASKRFSYSFPVYKARCQLAAIDYMKHLDRQTKMTKDGKECFHRKFSKHSNHWTVYKVKEIKTYDYIPELLLKIIAKYQTERVPLSRPVQLKPDDPRKIKATVAPISPESTQKLAATKESRFSKH